MSSANQILPEASVLELAPGAAFAAAGNQEVVAFMGPTTRGTVNVPRVISAQDVATLVSVYGSGPAVKEAARFLVKVGQPIVFCRMTTGSVAGVLGAVAVTRTAGGTAPTNTISGTPTDGADVVIQYGTVGGLTGTGPIAYTISLDGGNTYGSVQALGAATTIVVLGVTLTLGSGKTITAGDTTAWLQTVASSTIRPLTFTGTGNSAITATGTPLDAYEVGFQVIVGGTIGTAGIVFRYTLDANAPSPVWSANISLGTATSYLLIDGPLSTESTGVTLNFAAGTLVALDSCTFGTSAPAYDSAGATAALGTLSTGLLGFNGTWSWIRMVGPVTASLAGTIDSIVAGFDSANHPAWAVVDYRDRATTETPANHSLRFQTDFANYTSTRVGVTFGLCRYTDVVNGRNNRRSPMAPLTARAQAYPINVNWAEFGLGPLTADVTLFDVNGNLVEHNANTDNGPNSMGAITLRTWPSQSGVYPTQACLMGPDTDIKLIPLRRVMNKAKGIQYQVEQLQVLQSPQVYVVGDKRGTAGNLVEAYARMVEREARALINTGMGSTISGFTFSVSRTPISLGGGNYQVKFILKIQPRVYIVKADGTAQFTNPALDVINTAAPVAA